jgi:hypothetical protein
MNSKYSMNFMNFMNSMNFTNSINSKPKNFVLLIFIETNNHGKPKSSL